MEYKHLRCLDPFASIHIDHYGDVWVCPCLPWTKLPKIGNIWEQSLDEIWNSDSAQGIRKLFYAEKYWDVCRPELCPKLHHSDRAEWQDLPYLTPAHHEALAAGKTRLDASFTKVYLTTDFRCNLRCVMCDLPRNRVAESRHCTVKALEVLQPYLQHIRYLSPATCGDLFAIPELMDLLAGPTLAENGARIHLVTNGTLFTERNWARIGHNTFETVGISVDAIGETYEKIRVNGNWERLRQNLDLVSRLKKEGRLSHVGLLTVVMKDTLPQLRDMVRLARELDLNYIAFQRIFGDYGEQNIFQPPDRKSLEQLHRILQDPLFEDWRVDLSNLMDFKTDAWREMLRPTEGKGESRRIKWHPRHVIRKIRSLRFN